MRQVGSVLKAVMVLASILSLNSCKPEPVAMQPEVVGDPVNVLPVDVSVDEFASSFRARNAEIRNDLIAELTKREIPFRLNEDGSIGYRQVDGKDIDAVYYWVVGLYAARN